MSDASGNKLALDMISDMSHFVSEKGVSEITGATEQEMFHRRWEKIINSGMEKEDLTFLNPMASKMLPKHDSGVSNILRLQKELGELSQRLPKRISGLTTMGNHLRKLTAKPSFNAVQARVMLH